VRTRSNSALTMLNAIPASRRGRPNFRETLTR
jgi:hypothetical protein